jgi:hypothetical protein
MWSFFGVINPSRLRNPGFETLEGFGFRRIATYVSYQFSHLFNSYTQAYNKRYNRRGSLFVPRVKRKQITDEAYFTNAIAYIHRNPINHCFADALEDWTQSSYGGIVRGDDAIVPVDEVLEWFGGKDQFVAAHLRPSKFKSVFD